MQPAHCGANEPKAPSHDTYRGICSKRAGTFTRKKRPAAHFRDARSEEVPQLQVLVSLRDRDENPAENLVNVCLLCRTCLIIFGIEDTAGRTLDK
jgi:hypothetical protein